MTQQWRSLLGAPVVTRIEKFNIHNPFPILPPPHPLNSQVWSCSSLPLCLNPALVLTKQVHYHHPLHERAYGKKKDDSIGYFHYTVDLRLRILVLITNTTTISKANIFWIQYHFTEVSLKIPSGVEDQVGCKKRDFCKNF